MNSMFLEEEKLLSLKQGVIVIMEHNVLERESA
jgi:hypothetical protein